MGAEVPHPELKRIEFVPAYLSKGKDLVSYVYTTTKKYVPSSLEPQVKAVEDKVAEYGSPWVTYTQDKGEQALKFTDSKLDYVVKRTWDAVNSTSESVSHAVEGQKKFHSGNLEHYKQARQAYLDKIHESVEFLREKGLTGTAKYALDQVAARVEEVKKLPVYLEKETKVVIDKLGDAWSYLVSLPPVSKLVETSKPSIDFASKKYQEAHDTVVASPTYKQLYEGSTHVVKSLEGSYVYKTTAKNVYPIVAPIADPVIDRIVHTKTYETVLGQLKPATFTKETSTEKSAKKVEHKARDTAKDTAAKAQGEAKKVAPK